ncbi:menaquinone biosynthesis decarboxylase [Nitratifractor salsuginis]|uniref:3-octaprenyl-4hydroxybenzoate decarboxylase n=1 Tax=Nitratifractor salsuginis (strain DSM 16511 / JCM 12458 / E9I37-1) TaxID=749222 RepID=E6X3K7_NITSE|nr:menaquinone biosynthesis decarboxylase [Nitratifractor salsuginis]ADV46284.1 3-octaprenyl-4hydroxybenzoate decarboxylase [Nitratifractor salsuginis DSM 16511]
MDRLIEWLKKEGGLRVIDEPLDVELEIPHVAYLEVKKGEASRPLLFTRPVWRAKGIEYDMPVLMNLYANQELTRKILGRHPDEVAVGIEELMKLKPPKGLKAKLQMLPKLLKLKNVFPKRLKFKGECQEIVIPKEEVDLDALPILKTWPEDGGRFITMGQVYTRSLDGTMQNLGMYRLQQYDKKRLGMHWQIHKDASHFFDQYRDAGKKMPVTVCLGGDPLYIWCGQAPMPHGMFELLLYGFIRGKNAQLVKSLSNDIYIPRDVDIVIEGSVDPAAMEVEGPFGDHTGYYTLPEPFPVMEVQTVTMKKNPVFPATVVGKPPLEDKYMGWATERIFLPMLKPMAPDLIDYNMPENGVFHNLILAKMEVHYKGHAQQFMHAFWGVGQMSFVKHAVFVGKEAPELTEYEALTRHILDRLDPEKILITQGIVDQLDHSSPQTLVGGKLGIDATGPKVPRAIEEHLSDQLLLEKAQALAPEVRALKQYMTDTANPITVIAIEKKRSAKATIDALEPLSRYIAVLVVVDTINNDLENPYMLLWRVVNNIDAQRDIFLQPFIAIDGTNKNSLDGYVRLWPGDTHCDEAVLERLREKRIIDLDETLIRKWGLLPFDLYGDKGMD